MNREYDGRRYEIPLYLVDRFDYIINKIKYAKEGDFIELYRGYVVVFNAEFKKYESR